MKALSLFAAIVSLTLLAVPADASLINIDHTAYDTMGVGTADGHHVVGVLGGVLDIRWNQINLFSSNTYTGLYDSRGIVTGTSFWATSVSKTLSGTDTVAGALFAGMLLDGGEFKFSGLTAGQAYELVLYSSWGFDGSGAVYRRRGDEDGRGGGQLYAHPGRGRHVRPVRGRGGGRHGLDSRLLGGGRRRDPRRVQRGADRSGAREPRAAGSRRRGPAGPPAPRGLSGGLPRERTMG